MSNRMVRLERRVKKMTLIKIALLAFSIIFALGFIYQVSSHAKIAITKMMEDVKVVEYGVLEDKLSGKAIVLNKEEVVLAQSEGRFENMVKENERIPKGALLGYFINSQGQAPMRTQLSGIFTRQTYGLEQIFQEVDFQTATPEIFKYKTKQVSQDTSVVAGQAIYKIVDSLQPTRLLIHFSQNDIDFDIKANQNVNIIMGGKDLGKAEIVEIKNDSGEMLLMVEFTSFCEELLNQRFIEVEVVFDSHSGCLIAEKALVEKEGKKGVYCLNGEDIVFKPVTVIKEKDNKIIVEGLNRNDMLLNNPRI